MEKYVGERIRKARNAKKMSQEDLAEIVDVRRQTIGEYERGGDIPLYGSVCCLGYISLVSIVSQKCEKPRLSPGF